MTKPIPMIIDTDPGIDDAMAILYALQAPEINLVGLTAVFGNVTVDQATRNALALGEMAGQNIPVARGCVRPLVAGPFAPSYHVHGDEGFGNYPTQKPKRQAVDLDAADFLITQAAEFAGELVVCPIGPLTNIATALERDSGFARNVKKIVLMGGSLREGGNITPHAEANFYHDPHAAQIVLDADCRVALVGLDVTHRTWATRQDMAEVALAAPRLGGFLRDIADFYIDFYVQLRGEQGCFLHDPLAVICATNPELFTFEQAAIDITLEGPAAGKSAITAQGRAQNIAVTVQANAVKNRFMAGLRRLDEGSEPVEQTASLL